MSKRIRPQFSRVFRGFSLSKKDGEKRVTRQSKFRRRAQRGAALGLTLFAVGATYSIFAPGGAAQEELGQTKDMQIAIGKALFDQSCITCHGRNLQGVKDRGPSLIGVGEAAVYFQVSTGRMPAGGQGPQIERVKDPKFGSEEANAIAAYVVSVGDGPAIPKDLSIKDADAAAGGELFRLNCASCHNFAGQGGALSAGKFAPSLKGADVKQIYGAMLSGPQSMPVFSDNQLTPDQKRDIISYLMTLRNTNDPGGSGLGQLGPVPEGIVAWVVGIGGLLFASLWIGVRR